MTDCCNPLDTTWADQLTVLRALVVAYNAALLAFATSNIQSYQLDSGQTRQLVTRAQLATLRDTRNDLLNDLSVLEGRVNCSNTLIMVPGF